MATAPDWRLPYFEPMKTFLNEAIGDERFAQCRTILEFGCGNRGGMIDLYRLPHQKAYGVDLRDWSDRFPPWMEFVVSDGRAIPLPSESIDFTFSHSVIEHIEDVHQSFSELNRITKVGGLIYLTVSPLYYSARGAHSRHIPLWDHLAPDSQFYMTQAPLGENGRVGGFLNKYTVSEFLTEVGRQPWDILLMTRQREKSTPPPAIAGQADLIDLMTRGFKIMLRKSDIRSQV